MEIRKISSLFWLLSPNLFFLSLILGVITGLCYSLLVPFVLYAASTPITAESKLLIENFSYFYSPTSDMAKVFISVCLTIVFIKSTSTILSSYIAQRASVQLRLVLYRRINKLPYANLEKIGQAKLINLLNIDIPNLTFAASALPMAWIGGITILGTLGYLLYLNVNIFLFVLGFLCVAVITYQIPILFGARYFAKSRSDYDLVQQGVVGLVNGAKDLKLSSKKSQEYINRELIEHESSAFRGGIIARSIMIFAEAYGEIISFMVIGVVIFHLPYVYQITEQELFGIVMALLYLTGPVGVVLTAANHFQNGRVALTRVISFYDVLIEDHCSEDQQDFSLWQEYRLDSISYHHLDSKDAFMLKNISLIFRKGQITFIVGGNGSGKSTLSKVISLHYQQSGGRIYIGDLEVGAKNVASVREFISVIYSDFYIFPRLYGEFDQGKVDSYLLRLGLHDKVKIVNSQFNTVSLSDGQRKRLALLALLLDDRPICLFDEWAADQDPHFKAIFYQDILQELKTQGKIVIVISHDDRYFNYADQLVVMDQGSVREIVDR